MTVHRPRYGRNLDDFIRGDVYDHPWEVTVDGGMLAVWQASFLDANALYSSDPYAQAVGFRGRVVPPALVLNLGLSFSVHDVSEQAIAHLAYLDVRFPRALHVGDTFRAFSQVISAKPSTGDDGQGIVHVRTVGLNQFGEVVLSFERKALVPRGNVLSRPDSPVRGLSESEQARITNLPFAPQNVHDGASAVGSLGQPFRFEDFAPGDVLLHDTGRTVGDTEPMTLATLTRNTHPLHTDQGYSVEHSFAKTRVVYGGLVLAWTLALASRDTGGNTVWELGLDDGAHPAPVLAGDTLYAASKVVSTKATGLYTGEVRLRTVGVKNTHPEALLAKGADLFTAERDKAGDDARVKEKVVEITRDVLVRRRERAS